MNQIELHKSEVKTVLKATKLNENVNVFTNDIYSQQYYLLSIGSEDLVIKKLAWSL